MNTTHDPLAEVSRRPDLAELVAEYWRAGGNYQSWQSPLEATRLCVWDGQSSDGKKHREKLGKEPFPWESSSDVRTHLCDGAVRELVDVCLTGFNRAQLKCQPVEAGDIDRAGMLTKALDYYRGLNRRELRAEAELMLQWGLTSGAAVWQVTWDRQITTRDAVIDLEGVGRWAEQALGPEAAGPVTAMILDPTQEDAAAQMALDVLPSLKTLGRAKKLVRDLRDQGSATYPKPYVCRNSPSVTALRIGADIFFPPETADLQRARVIFRRDFLTETELRENVLTEGWDAAWVDESLKTRGFMTTWNLGDALAETAAGASPWQYSALQTENNLVEVLWAYVRQVDGDGIPRITCTVFSPHLSRGRDNVEGLCAWHGALDYAHGQYPFVEWTTEKLSRRITASRGVPAVTHTWQNEEKAQCDMLADRASLEINPPLRVPKRLGQLHTMSPGRQMDARPGEIEYVDPPKGSPELAFKVIEMVQLRTANYYGLMHPEVLPAKWQMKLQRVTESWLASCEAMFAQMAALVLQPDLVSDAELERVCGVQLGADREAEAIARRFDWELTFDVRDLDLDWTMKKLDAVAKLAVPLDRGGLVDYAKLVGLVLASIDPTLARAIVSDQGSASRRMFDEVNKDAALMALGNEAQYSENDPAAALKLQMLNGIVQNNPKYQAALQSDERFRELIENYAKNLQMSVKQQENVGIGRTGVKPVGA